MKKTFIYLQVSKRMSLKLQINSWMKIITSIIQISINNNKTRNKRNLLYYYYMVMAFLGQPISQPLKN